VGIYATTPAAYEPYDSADLDEAMSQQVVPHFETNPNGEGKIEAYTLAYDREGQVKTAIIAGRLLQDDARFLAKAGRDAPDVLKRFGNSHLGEQSVLVTAGEQGNSFSFL